MIVEPRLPRFLSVVFTGERAGGQLTDRVFEVLFGAVERPLVKTDDSAVGFYALNGESLVTFKETEEKERICEVLEKVREQNPASRILLVLDKHGSHICLMAIG